jgi:hypothetical protein
MLPPMGPDRILSVWKFVPLPLKSLLFRNEEEILFAGNEP